MDKLQKIRSTGKYCCINISSDFDYIWYLTVIPDTQGVRKEDHEPILMLQGEELDKLIDLAYDKLMVEKITEFYSNSERTMRKYVDRRRKEKA